MIPSVLSVPIQRVRVRLARRGKAVPLSHLQQIDQLRRAFEKSQWPINKTGGRRPKLKISFGPAISVGYESDCEYCDVELVSRLDLKEAFQSIQTCLPEGYLLRDIKSIPRFFPSLENTINVARYELTSSLFEGKKMLWDNFWRETSHIIVKKKGSGDVAIDARPLVRQWGLVDNKLELVLRFGPGKTLKPERIAQDICQLSDDVVAMGTDTCQMEICRTNMYLEKQNGELAEI